jgi:orotate phosphoribosyltransferase
VISAGTSVRESVRLIREHGATPCAVLIALDRQERGQGERSAAQEVSDELGLPVVALANLTQLLAFAAASPELHTYHAALLAYRQAYGVADGSSPDIS